jgi:hypothetical protein
MVTFLEVEGGEEVVDDRRDPRRGEVGVGGHRHGVGTHQPVGGDAPIAVGKCRDHLVPGPPVDQVDVDEDDRRPRSRLPTNIHTE